MLAYHMKHNPEKQERERGLIIPIEVINQIVDQRIQIGCTGFCGCHNVTALQAPLREMPHHLLKIIASICHNGNEIGTYVYV